MRRLGGHLGAGVSALVDGQLDAAAEDQAWAHVVGCPGCRSALEREVWVKNRLAQMYGGAPPEHLRPRLQRLSALPPVAGPDSLSGAGAGAGVSAAASASAWAQAAGHDPRVRARRRAGIAAAGAGSVSAAVLGLATLGGSPLSLGGAGATPSGPGSAPPSRTTVAPAVLQLDGGPSARARGRLNQPAPGP